MSRGRGRSPRRAGWIRRRHGGGAKIGADGGGIDRVMKPAGVGNHCGGGGSICACNRHTRRSRLRVDAEGNLYVLDSESEMSDTDVAADGVRVVAEGATNRNRAGNCDMSVDGPQMVTAELGRAAVKDLLPKGPPPVASDGASVDDQTLPSIVEEMDLAPEVATRLKEVLANKDPIYHDVFVSMYKKFHSGDQIHQVQLDHQSQGLHNILNIVSTVHK